MKTVTINSGESFSRLPIMIMVILCWGCTSPCKQEVIVYQGLYLKKGQNFRLSIDDKVILEESFNSELQRNDLKRIDNYCCDKDSCQVIFSLGHGDTVFYLSPSKTKRLMVGSDIYGKFSVATDENKRSWIQM